MVFLAPLDKGLWIDHVELDASGNWSLGSGDLALVDASVTVLGVFNLGYKLQDYDKHSGQNKGMFINNNCLTKVWEK